MTNSIPSLQKCEAPLLELHGIVKNFHDRASMGFTHRMRQYIGGKSNEPVMAVNDVNLSVHSGQIVGLVGESGCGKSTLGRIAADLLAPTRGSVKIAGKALASMRVAERQKTRLKTQMVFQNTSSSLNPKMQAIDLIGQGALYHQLVAKNELEAYVCSLLTQVGLDPDWRYRYPHQLSGGQKQRIGIARALAVNPQLLICDESVAALDVSIQAQVMNLFLDLREKRSLSYLFISHDLSVIRYLCDYVFVMYLGRVVECAPCEELYQHPAHPYTQALFASIPKITERKKKFVPLKGDLPSPSAPPQGCHFHTRCPYATKECAQSAPLLQQISSQHAVSCHKIIEGL